MEREKEYMEICKAIEKIVAMTNEPLEGNCVYKHNSFEQWECLENKRKNYQTLAKGKENICEIGFNAGHSILSMLLVNDQAKYVLFDLGSHKYSKPCYDYICKLFPKTRIKMVWGDSRETVPKNIESNPDTKFDLVHIDGGHKYEIYSKDWDNSLKIVTRNGFLIFDDTDNAKISAFLDKEIEKGRVKEAKDLLETFGYQHRIFINNQNS